MTHPSCPPAAAWVGLLSGAVPADRETAMTAHLETCPDCRQTLEACAADADVWARAARHLGAGPADPVPAADDLPGPFGPYRTLDVLGRGGMGLVLKAYDPLLARIVALKVPELSGRADARERFVREARAAAAVRDEHVVQIHAVADDDPAPYLVMEFVAGGSVQDRLAGGPLPVAEAVRIGREAAAGLAAAHARGLVHRDVKPGNILLAADTGRVKLTDFGLARAADDPRLTRDGIVAGTPDYMSPEQARSEPLGPRSDLFSLGSVLYALLTGKPPFRTDSAIATLQKVCEADPVPVRRVNPAVPAWLAALVHRLLARDPARRPESAAAVVAALEAGPTGGWKLGRLAVVVAAVALIGGLVAWAAWPRNPAAPTEPHPEPPPAPAPRAVLFVLPAEGFSFPEYSLPRSGLDRADFKVVVAAPTMSEVEPNRRPNRPAQAVRPARRLDEVRGDRFRAVYLCGGPGFTAFRTGEPHAAEANRLIDEAVRGGRIVAAFGTAPAVLADGGWLRARRATCFVFSQPPRVFVAALERGGATFVDEPFVEDGPFLTGRDPADIASFTRRLIELIDRP